jgi:predicted aldo/keto reductase-like oxidoreductase
MIREAYKAKKSIGSTGCRYCMPCPQSVEIPEIFKLYNSQQLMKKQNTALNCQRIDWQFFMYSWTRDDRIISIYTNLIFAQLKEEKQGIY